MDASAPELYERYLVPAITSIWASDLLDRISPSGGESVLDIALRNRRGSSPSEAAGAHGAAGRHRRQ
jgi:hypothetical protein